jgi:hypothetical protein
VSITCSDAFNVCISSVYSATLCLRRRFSFSSCSSLCISMSSRQPCLDFQRSYVCSVMPCVRHRSPPSGGLRLLDDRQDLPVAESAPIHRSSSERTALLGRGESEGQVSEVAVPQATDTRENAGSTSPSCANSSPMELQRRSSRDPTSSASRAGLRAAAIRSPREECALRDRLVLAGSLGNNRGVSGSARCASRPSIQTLSSPIPKDREPE